MFQYPERVFNRFPEYREIRALLEKESRRKAALFYLRWKLRPSPSYVLMSNTVGTCILEMMVCSQNCLFANILQSTCK